MKTKNMMSGVSGISLAIAFLTCSMVGCGGDGFSRVPLSGTVTFEGDANRSGALVVTPQTAGTGAPNATAVITDGKFSFPPDQGPVAGGYVFEVSLTVPDETDSDSGESSPEDANETGGNSITYQKMMEVPDGGSESFAIELTAADELGADGVATPSGEL